MGFFTSAADSSASTAQAATQQPILLHWADDKRIIKVLGDSGLLAGDEAVRCFMLCCKLTPTEGYKQFVAGFNASYDVIARVVDKLTAVKELFELEMTKVDDAMSSAEHEQAAAEFAAAEAHKAELVAALEQAQAAAAQAANDAIAARAAASAICASFTAGKSVTAIELQSTAEAVITADARKANADECVAKCKDALDAFQMPPPPAEQDFPEWAVAANFVDSMSCVPNTLEFAPHNMRSIESSKLVKCLKYAADNVSSTTLEADAGLKCELTAAVTTLADRVISDCQQCITLKHESQATSLIEGANNILKWGLIVGNVARKAQLEEMITKLHALREVAAYNRRKAEIMSQ